MQGQIQTVLEEFHQRAARERQLMDELPREDFMARVDEFLLPVGPEVGQLMNLLVKTGGARTLVEAGTSHGYSAIWLAEAARETGGTLYSFDVHEAKQDFARQALERAGLAGHVTFVLGDVAERIGEVPGPVEFALVDHWKNLYLPCFQALAPRLAPGAILVADNMTFPVERHGEVTAYREAVAATPGMQTMLLPVGNGIELSRYSP